MDFDFLSSDYGASGDYWSLGDTGSGFVTDTNTVDWSNGIYSGGADYTSFDVSSAGGSGDDGLDWGKILSTAGKYALPLYQAYQGYKSAKDIAAAGGGGTGGGGGGSYSGLSPGARAIADNAYAVLGGVLTSQDFTKAAALKDSEAGVKQIFAEYKNTDLPKIYQNQVSSGGYNSVVHQLLADNAFSSAVAKGQAFQTDTVAKYAKARQDEIGTLLQLVLGDRVSTSSGGGGSGSSAAADAKNKVAKDKAQLDLITKLLGAGGAVLDSAGAFDSTGE